MADSTENSNQPTDITDVGKRPYVRASAQRPLFHVGDRVFLLNASGAREGPYLIASVPGSRNYTLCFEDGRAVKNNQMVDVDEVEAA